MASRGRPIGCSFYEVDLLSEAFRYRSVENVINEQKWLKRENEIKAFMMADDNFSINQKRVTEFCRTLIYKRLELQ